MPDSAKAASLVSIRAAPPDPASHHVASFRSWPSPRRRYPSRTGARPADGRNDHDVVAEIQEDLLSRIPPQPIPQTRALGAAHAYAHRFAPLHSFAAEHHRFFQDAEVEELIKERCDIRPHLPPRRRR